MTPARALPLISEKALQLCVVQHLSLLGWLVLEYGKPGGHRRLAGALPPGHPDLCCIKDGRIVWLELKTPQGKVTDRQELMHLEMTEAGANIRVVRSIEEAEQAVKGELP